MQTKLEIGAPNDRFEREAERVADQVMGVADGEVAAAAWAREEIVQRRGQRMCDECAGAEMALQRMPLSINPAWLVAVRSAPVDRPALLRRQEVEKDERLQATSATGSAPRMGRGVEAEFGALQGRGQPLSLVERAFFEPRFGHDFDQVRLHRGADAAALARTLRARAFTVGRDVFFGSGQFATSTRIGRRLLAHELAHVVQQSRAPVAVMGHALAGGETSKVSLTSPLRVARKDDDNPGPTCEKPVKTVGLDFVSLGPSRDPQPDMDLANEIYAPCCVRFSKSTGVSADEALVSDWLADVTEIQAGSCGKPSSDELDAYLGATAAFGLSSRFRIFYVESTSRGPDTHGYAYAAYCATGTAAVLNGMIVIDGSADPRSVAHELAHALLDTRDHGSRTENLIYPTDGATGSELSYFQCDKIYKNA